VSQNWNAPVASTASLQDGRTTVNAALEALRTAHSGATAPSATVAYMLWADTNEGWVKQRNAANNGWVYLWKLADLAGAGVVHRVAGWVTHAATTLTLSQIPANHVVLRQGIYVAEAFNSDGTDQIKGGRSGDDDAYATLTDVSTTGVKTPTSGAEIGLYSNSARTPIFTYVAGGSAASTGKALCWIEYMLVPVQP